ncbi:MAG: flippase-like domain-containing protein [Myxococcales bacterium]|nr:flippase-like domain-containing protein [Myxococcales bacterium]
MRARSLSLAAVLLVTLICVVIAAAVFDLRGVAELLLQTRPELLVAAVAALLVAFACRVGRMQLLLHDAAPSWRRQAVVSAVGFLAIHVVPLRLGELVRPHLLADDGVPWGRSLGAIAVERLTDVLALLVMIAIVGSLDPPDWLKVADVDVLHTASRAFGIAAVVLLGVLLAFALGGETVATALEGVPVLGPRLAGLARSMSQGLSALARDPVRGAGVVALAAVVWTSHVVVASVLLLAVPEVPTGLGVGVTVTALTVIGVATVPTLGQVGPFEAGAVAALMMWGSTADPAAAFAVLIHALVFLFNSTVGAVGLYAEGASLSSVVRASQGSA